MSSEVARLFDAMADSYEELEPWYEHLYATLHAILREVLVPPTGARPRALDAGCGTGFQAAILADLGYEVHGADLAGGLLAVARRRVPAARLTRSDVEALPYRDAAFDAVTCCGSTLSFVAAPGRAIAEMARVLRPGGRLLLDCEHKWSLDLAWMLLSGLTGNVLGYDVSPGQVWSWLRRPVHEGFVAPYPPYAALRFFTLREIDGMLGAAGLSRRGAWGIHALTNLLPSTVLHRPRVPRGLGGVYAILRRGDRALACAGLDRHLANTLVVLAQAHVAGTAVATRPRMATTLLEFQARLFSAGREYRARACGRPLTGNTWEGWLEFVPGDGGTVIASGRETTQPNLTDLEYWATGLTPIYLEGALDRSLSRVVRPAPPPLDPPAHAGPAAPRISTADPEPLHPVLDPFSVYAKGEDLLRQQLRALSVRHLRTIVRAYELSDGQAPVDTLGNAELIALIMAQVRTRAA